MRDGPVCVWTVFNTLGAEFMLNETTLLGVYLFMLRAERCGEPRVSPAGAGVINPGLSCESQ